MSKENHLSEAPAEEMEQGALPVSFLSLIAFAFCIASLPSIWLAYVSTFAAIAILLGIVAVIRGRFQPSSLLIFSYLSILISGSILSWTISSKTMYDNRLISSGNDFALQWIDHIAHGSKEGEIEKALSLQQEYPNRLAPSSTTKDLVSFFKQNRPIPERKFKDSPAQTLKNFVTGPENRPTDKNRLVMMLMQSGGKYNAKLVPGKTLVHNNGRRKGITQVNIEFDLTISLPGDVKKELVRITLERVNYREGPQWRILSWDTGETDS